MDIIFDIDGTLADASHRLHFINDTAYWKSRDGKPPSPDWESFLASDLVSKDEIIRPIWTLMDSLLASDHGVLFITGRRESERAMTEEWLSRVNCDVRRMTSSRIRSQNWPKLTLPLYMRQNGDRRPSDVVKREGLQRARADGFVPELVFEDRNADTAMWRSEGLICCQVADGDY